MPTETTLNSLKVHKVPDFETWEENYNQTNGIGTSDVVVIPPEELKKGVLPDQTNNSGKFLSTNGTSASWETVDALPSQSGNSGKFLTTNGTAASWGNIPENTFIAEIGVTSFTDILTAYNANKIIFASDSTYKDSFWLQNILYTENGQNIETFVFSRIENHTNDVWWGNSSPIQLTCVTCSYDTSRSNNTHWQNAVIPLQEDVYALSNLSGNTGKYLSVQQNEYGTYVDWANIPEKVFIATYGTTTYADVLAAYNAGKTLFVSKDGYWATLGTYSSNTFNFYVFIMGTCYRYSVSSTGWTTGTLAFQTSLPSQSNNSGKYLTTNGSSLSWANSPVTSVNTKSGDVTLTASDVGAVATSTVGAASGIAPLNASSKIDSTYLPSYVDDVIEGYYYNSKFYTTSAHTTEITGETGKIFVDLTTNKTYRYGGSSFTEISQGSIVSVSRDLTTGTKIGTLTINGTGTDLYAPTPETFSVTGGASTIVSDNLTANRALISNANGKVAVSDVTSTELGYLDGVTSAIQTQIDGKQTKVTASGILKGDGSGGVTAATVGTDYQTPLPSQTNNSGKFLTTNGSALSWANAPEETFVAIYQTTTFSEILQAYNEGKILYAQLDTNTNLKYFLDQIVWSSTEATINEFRFFVIDDEHNDPWAVSSNIKLRGLICSSTGGYNGWSNITRTLQENVEALSNLSGNSGKFLTTNGSSASWGDIPEEVFVAVGGVTTYNELATAIAENKIIFVNAYGSGHQAPREAGWFYFIDSTLANSSEIVLRSHGPVQTVSFSCTNNDEWSSSTSDNSATSSRFGHVILSDSTSSTSGTSDGIAATPAAVKAAYDLAVARTKIYTATCSTGASTAAKVATLDDSTGFSLAAGVKVAVTFTYGNSATTPTLNVNSSGAKTIAIPSSATAYTTGNGTTYNTWGAYETVLFTYTGTYWTHDTSGYLGYLAYNTASGRQTKITASGILKGDGSGGVTAATAGTDYAAASHTHGDITNAGDITATAPTIASGDKIIINDESASKITNGPSFGTSTTTYLRNDGSWNTPADNRDPGYGKIKPGTASTSTSAITANTTAAEASTYNETLTINPGNKWVSVAGSNSSTAGSDTFTIGHSAGLTAKTNYGSTSTTASANGGSITVTDIKYDEAGHITASTDRTITLSQSDTLPSQTGNSGKYLTTNGSAASWATVDLSSKANIASPTFTGTPAAPTATAGTNTTQIATTAFVNTALTNKITYGTTDLTAGTSALATGVIYLVYE